jgi:tetratricopeptide (TPR) repeat protein
MLDRLAGIILRIRQEAAYWLGFQTAKRGTLWKDELNFALAVYGMLNVRWDYSGPEQESALISAGVALARSPQVPLSIKQAVSDGKNADAIQPTYRVPLALAFTDWKEQQYADGCHFVDQWVLEVTRDKSNVVTKIDVRRQMQHAVPLIGHALLLHLEVGDQHAVESVLEQMRAEARTFHDFETLARVGRVYKDAADRRWEAEMNADRTASQPRGRRPPSQQMYDKSLEVYAEAYELTRDWYVGINAATLALLTGKLELASRYAGEVALTCADKVDHDTKNRYWLFATEGEAALILGSMADALNYYQSAIDELTPGQSGMANSSYLQAVRLWKHFGTDGEKRVGSVLELFENSHFGHSLKPGFLGRKQ